MKSVICVMVTVLASGCSIQTEKLTAGKVLQFGAGVGSGLLCHEAGHYVVAKAEELEYVKFRGMEVTYCGEASRSEKMAFYAAGFGADIISSEILMSNNKLFPKDNCFVLGWLAWTMFEPFSYTLRHELSSDGYGDLRGLDEAGVNSELVEVGLIAHSVLTYYRLNKNPDFPIRVSIEKSACIFGLEYHF